MAISRGLPPDIQERMAQPAGGVGGAAAENTKAAIYRQQALHPDAPVTEPEPEKKPEPKAAESDSDLKVCPNPTCPQKLVREWLFCSRCGSNLLRNGAAKQIGIELTEEDLHDYLFRGYVMRDIKILGKHVATFKSSQPKELREIDDYMMNGSWGKDENGRDRKISEFYMRQLNAMCMAAASIVKLDGEAIGVSFSERIDWMQNRGSAFVDLVSQKAALFNQSVTEFLKDQETVLGS